MFSYQHTQYVSFSKLVFPDTELAACSRSLHEKKKKKRKKERKKDRSVFPSSVTCTIIILVIRTNQIKSIYMYNSLTMYSTYLYLPFLALSSRYALPHRIAGPVIYTFANKNKYFGQSSSVLVGTFYTLLFIIEKKKVSQDCLIIDSILCSQSSLCYKIFNPELHSYRYISHNIKWVEIIYVEKCL